MAKFVTVLVAASASIGADHGGWATITVENLPDQLVVGTPYNLTFSVRQHGDNLLSDLDPYIELRTKGGEERVRAVATNKPGYYTATINVPKAGAWAANIESSFGRSNLELLPIAAIEANGRAVIFSDVERGQRLFVAKGCTLCHVHASVRGSGRYQVGPELTARRFEAGYLRRYLADPSIKPPTARTRMPNLHLSAADITSLAAFINADAPVRTAQRK